MHFLHWQHLFFCTNPQCKNTLSIQLFVCCAQGAFTVVKNTSAFGQSKSRKGDASDIKTATNGEGETYPGCH